jgi:hypothetical protein
LLSAKKFAESFFFAENICFYSRQRDLRRELEIKLSPKSIALGEDSVSRSVWCMVVYIGDIGGIRVSSKFYISYINEIYDLYCGNGDTGVTASVSAAVD